MIPGMSHERERLVGELHATFCAWPGGRINCHGCMMLQGIEQAVDGGARLGAAWMRDRAAGVAQARISPRNLADEVRTAIRGLDMDRNP